MGSNNDLSQLAGLHLPSISIELYPNHLSFVDKI